MIKSSSRPITTLFGIPLFVHWTALLTALIVAASASTAVGISDPTIAATLTVGILAVVLFEGSLLAHEFAHALVARSRGIGVDGVHLWAFGGMAHYEQAPRTPRNEFSVSIAGPLASIALAIVALAAAFGINFTGAEVPTTILLWTGLLNLVLGLFNLLPGLPLDGGRVLHSLIWWKTKDHNRATIATATIGKGLGILVIAGSVWAFIQGGGGIVGVFIGYVMLSNAGHARSAAARANLRRGVNVGSVARPVPTAVFGDLSAGDYLQYWNPTQPSGDVIMLTDRNHQMTGLVERSTIERIPDHVAGQITLDQLSVSPTAIAFVSPEMDLADALALSESGIVIATTPERLIGIVMPEHTTSPGAN